MRARLAASFAVALGACATAPAALPAAHPANPSAPTGRLAGAPATLRPGVATYADVPATHAEPAEPAVHHHHHGS
jgi:hypothetical protein